MPRFFFLFCILSCICVFADGPVLLRSGAVVYVKTVLGDRPATVTPVTPAKDVTVVVLTDTLQSEDLGRIQKSLQSAFGVSFLRQHSVMVIPVSSASTSSDGQTIGVALTNASQLTAALAAVSPTTAPVDVVGTLPKVVPVLPMNWARVVIIGRLPAAMNDIDWVKAGLEDLFARRRANVSFWSLDGTAPDWAQNLSGATAGLVATSDMSALLPILNDAETSYSEVSWDSGMPIGAWPEKVTIVNAAGDTVVSVETLMAAQGFTIVLAPYLELRKAMDAKAVLAANPSDVDALRLAAKSDKSIEMWRRVTQIVPGDGEAFGEMASLQEAAGLYDDAESSLKLAAANQKTLETQALLLVHRKNYTAAIPALDQVLVNEKGEQRWWLLRADCARSIRNWPLEAESLERAVAIGTVPFERDTHLIEGYLLAQQMDAARVRLKVVTAGLPREAPVMVQYAGLWKRAGDVGGAVKLWREAIRVSAKYEPAYVELGQHYLDEKVPLEAVKVAEDGLEMIPNSGELMVVKVTALETQGDIYAARRFLKDHAADAKQVELLRRWARLEDCCGGDGARAYLALMKVMTDQGQLREVCQRGLMVALRSEQMDAAKTFAEKLALLGDQSGLRLLKKKGLRTDAQMELLGGAEALHFLLYGNLKSKNAEILLDYSRVLSGYSRFTNASMSKAEWNAFSEKIHDYFRILAEVTALGLRKGDHYEVLLGLKSKPDKQRTEKVLSVLGLKLRNSKEGLTIGANEGKAQARKQDTLAALAVDDGAIQDALGKGQTFTLEIPVDSVPVFPRSDLWRQTFGGHDSSPGGLVELLLTDERLPLLYAGLNSMDRTAAQQLVSTLSLRLLGDKYCAQLSLYSAALAMHERSAEVPGGEAASAVWQQLTGASPTSPGPFFETLLSKDDGRLMAYFYTLSQLDAAHQKFFTRTQGRAKRFYELFRDSPEMSHGNRVLSASSSFNTFLRELPLAEDGSVDFPGDPEVWMVAKGSLASTSVAKLGKKLKRTIAPDDEDEILIRLAKTGYKTQSVKISELANFIAVTRIDNERDHPLDRDSALLLAQGYSQYVALFTYFAELGDLTAGDYQSAFSLEAKASAMDPVSGNRFLGEVHALLAMIGSFRESGVAKPEDVLRLYRTGLDGLLKATDAGTRSQAALKAISDICELVTPKATSADDALRLLLVGENEVRAKTYRQLLALQKVPSLDGLMATSAALAKVDTAGQLDEIQRQLSKLEVVAIPRGWKMDGERKKQLESFQVVPAQNTLLKLRERLGKKKRNDGEVEKLSGQLMSELEPWVELAMVGQIYARFLDPRDLLVSEDALLMRKHELVDLGPSIGRREWLRDSELNVSSEGEGSYFTGGLAGFSLSAGWSRAHGNHLGGNAGEAFSGAMLASVRATDWRSVSQEEVRTFGATVRVAREWIVEAASDEAKFQVLERETLGLLSLVRRKRMLDAVKEHEWTNVWPALSISDLHFLGDALVVNAPVEAWKTDALKVMKKFATHSRELDALGSVAPELSGCTQPRLRRYEPYEEFERHLSPRLLAQRLSELKLYLAAFADDSAWDVGVLADLAPKVANSLAAKPMMRSAFDWAGVLDSYRELKAADWEGTWR